MTDPNTATLDECCDWLAVDDGWKKLPQGVWGKIRDYKDRVYRPTLDGAASAMPDGWYWWVNFTGMIVPYMAVAVERVPKQPQIEIRAPTEILARYRLAVACRLATRKDAQ